MKHDFFNVSSQKQARILYRLPLWMVTFEIYWKSCFFCTHFPLNSSIFMHNAFSTSDICFSKGKHNCFWFGSSYMQTYCVTLKCFLQYNTFKSFEIIFQSRKFHSRNNFFYYYFLDFFGCRERRMTEKIFFLIYSAVKMKNVIDWFQ